MDAATLARVLHVFAVVLWIGGVAMMSAMVAIWVLFTLLRFLIEPLVLHRWFAARAQLDPRGTLRLVLRAHRILLVLSLITIAGAVAGSHGLFFFG